MELIEASILARGNQPWIDVMTGEYRAKLRILRSKRSTRRDEVLQLFEIIVNEGEKTDLIKRLRASPEITELAVTHSSQGRIVGLLRAKGVIMRCIAESDCFLLHAASQFGAEIEWKVLGTRKSLSDLLAKLTKKGVAYKIGNISEVNQRRGLTLRQEWLIRSAYERGYFDYPKRIRLRGLASQLGVSAPTLFESLRKTTKKLLQQHFEESWSPLWAQNAAMGQPVGRSLRVKN